MRELCWASSYVPVIAAIGDRNKKSGIQDHPQLFRQLNGSQISRTCLNQMCVCVCVWYFVTTVQKCHTMPLDFQNCKPNKPLFSLWSHGYIIIAVRECTDSWAHISCHCCISSCLQRQTSLELKWFPGMTGQGEATDLDFCCCRGADEPTDWKPVMPLGFQLWSKNVLKVS